MLFYCFFFTYFDQLFVLFCIKLLKYGHALNMILVLVFSFLLLTKTNTISSVI